MKSISKTFNARLSIRIPSPVVPDQLPSAASTLMPVETLAPVVEQPYDSQGGDVYENIAFSNRSQGSDTVDDSIDEVQL